MFIPQDDAIVDVDVIVEVDVDVPVVVELVSDEVTTGVRVVLLKVTLVVVAACIVTVIAVVVATTHLRLIVPVPLGIVPANMLQSL